MNYLLIFLHQISVHTLTETVLNFRHTEALSPHPDDSKGHPEMVLAKWDPVGSGIAMVDANYNVLYKKNGKSNEPVQQVTNNGRPGIIHNGVPDWVYEGELLVWYYIK